MKAEKTLIETLDEEGDDAARTIDEFERVDISGGTKGISDEDTFDGEVKTKDEIINVN